VTTLWLARHGQSDWNAELRWQGHADRPLTALGRRQALELAEQLADTVVDAVYSSDLRRALETAEPVAGRKGLRVVEIVELREIDVGSWSGLSRAEAQARFPDGFERWTRGSHGWDDGETYEQMTERVVGAALRIAEAHHEESVLLVAHGGPIRALHAVSLGMDVVSHRQLRRVAPNAHLSRVGVENGAITRLD
jgi:broad specificity phosphatase PhoE